MWRNVDERDLQEALQGQKGHASIDDKPHELTRFTYKSSKQWKKKQELHLKV